MRFNKIPAIRDGKSGSTNMNDGMAAHLVAADPSKRVGTAIMLRTMPGDRFVLSADAYYEGVNNSDEEVSGEDMISSLMNALMGGNTYVGTPVNELPQNAEIIQAALGNASLPSNLENIAITNEDPAAPKAYLNYLFFNEGMELEQQLSGKIQVQAIGGAWTAIGGGSQVCNCAIGVGGGTTGYLLVYIDNQSIGKDVWFDNVFIEHYTSAVLEENHYYPFGLTLTTDAGTGVKPNPYKLTTKELEKNFDINAYDFGARMQDMQLGKWWSIDPFAEKYHSMSPYSYCLNNPVLFNDPDGRDAKLTGTGSKEDPLVVKAAYYYQNGSLTKEQVTGLDKATKDFNNLGVHEVENKDGSKSFVRYELSQEGVDDVEVARASTEFTAESADGQGETRYFGNVVSQNAEGSDAFGESDFRSISINPTKVDNEVGANRSQRIKGTWIHEIGHNLGALHEDRTSVMEQRGSAGLVNEVGDASMSNTVRPIYPSTTKKITPILLNKIGTNREKREGRIFKEKK